MKFINKEHLRFFKEHGAQYLQSDRQRAVFFYVIGISEGTRTNVIRLYNFEENLLKPEGLHDGWQTSSTIALTKLAFELFHSCPVLEENDPDPVITAVSYSISNIMCRLNEWVPYAIEAIKLMFE